MSNVEDKDYTVKEVASIAGVTIKTLHHYDALGLLKPARTSHAGYRIYTYAELERLQQILFYRELDIPLKIISKLLQGTHDRLPILREQRDQLLKRRERLGEVLRTINESIWHAEKGTTMEAKAMFKGISSADEWNDALKEQNQHLEKTYGVTTDTVTNADAMNELAAEATSFMGLMVAALSNKVAYDNPEVQAGIKSHVAFLNDHGHVTTAENFVKQTEFFLQDSFHRSMLEDQQIGLAYYLVAAAKAYAM